ncbi:MAG: tetratricopeptide (TPR) repeat protein [Bradymonadia bacterium]|jgi:tetratricopeptide (TPR) repeat protein
MGGHNEAAEEREGRSRGEAYAAYLRAATHAEHDEWQEAVDDYRLAIRLTPEEWPPYLAYVRAVAGLAESMPAERGSSAGDDENVDLIDSRLEADAWQALQTARELRAPDSKVAIAEAELAVELGDIDRAFAAFRQVPRSRSTRSMFSAWYDAGLDFDREEELLACATAYTEAFTDLPLAWRYLGFARRATHDLRGAADALAYATSLPDADPRDAEQHVETLKQLEAWDEALGAAVGCRVRFRDHVPCYVSEVVLRARGAEDELPSAALDAMDRLVARSAGNNRAFWGVRRELAATRNPLLVQALAQEILRQRPNSVQLLTQVAYTLSGVDDTDGSIDLFLRVLELDPSNFEALNFVGYSWADRGLRLEEAEEMIRQALFLRPDSGGIMDSLAWVIYRRGRVEEALPIMLEAVALDDESAVLWDHLGDILRDTGDLEGAASAYRQALEFADTRDEDVLDTVPEKLDAVLEQLGR